MLDPKVDAAVKGLSPLNWPLTVNDLELWNKENLVVAKNEKELLAHYMRYYHAKSSSLKNEFLPPCGGRQQNCTAFRLKLSRANAILTKKNTDTLLHVRKNTFFLIFLRKSGCESLLLFLCA